MKSDQKSLQIRSCETGGGTRRISPSRRIRFLTAIPQNVYGGSGAYVGIATLARGLESLGCKVDVITPRTHLPMYTAEQFWFNRTLRSRALLPCDAQVGFDLDGYAVAQEGGVPHIANIKGVLADAIQFESGMTRATMTWQARCERLHAERADAIITISEYCADRIREFYGVTRPIAIVPEPIDLAMWRGRFASVREPAPSEKFVVLCVCRFFPRKRVHLLLEAARQLRSRIPDLEVRVVGDGPEAGKLRRIWRERRLDGCVTWAGNASHDELASEYRRADVFCLPSVQEGFGIVFLEAMAAGKPIVAVRAAAIPEVIPHAVLVERDSAEALADGIEKLYREPELRESIAAEGLRRVERFDIGLVAAQFLSEMEKSLSAGIQSGRRARAIELARGI